MKKVMLAGALATALALLTMVPNAVAAAGDSITFKLVPATSATCLPSTARGRVTVSDLGQVQHMHLEVFDLVPNAGFTVFITQHNAIPFGFSWYQGEVQTDSKGQGVGDFSGIFSEETFTLTDTLQPIQMDHMGIWFADATVAGAAGCSSFPTPFDGDHAGGILVLSTRNFPDNEGPLLRLKE